MAVPRCYCPQLPLQTGVAFALDSAESHHLTRVLRLREGARVEVLDGKGGALEAHVARVKGKDVLLEGVEAARVETRQHALGWIQALPKGKLLDGLIRQAVELGVARIQPLLSQHSEVRLEADDRRGLAKAERWRAIAVEALKQSGNRWLPRIEPIAGFADWMQALSEAEAPDLRLVASLEAGTRPLLEVLEAVEPARCPEEVTLAIGPEGDFSAEEYAALSEAGFRAVGLGQQVLRVDTAAVCALGVLRQWLERVRTGSE
ncbi:MAG: RsmE family RNA methyltransferase [Opitutales bacterium]